MKLQHVEIARSPDRPGHVRLNGVVLYDRPRDGRAEETYWYEVPDAFAGDLSTSGNPWLAGLLPVAVSIGEPLVIARPVDAMLLDNVHDLMAIWHVWYPHRVPVAIEADVTPSFAPPEPDAPAPGRPARRTALFFSGGVDSFCTALRARSSPIDDLLLVLGSFDLVGATPASLDRVRAKLEIAADAIGKTLVPIATNQMRTRMAECDPRNLGGTPMLAAAALALERRYARVLVSASCDLDFIVPTGAHPLIPPLMSTSGTRFDEEGIAMTRIEKTAIVARCDAALAALRVCFMSGNEANCMQCVKCIRTATTLEALGVLGRATGFGGGTLDPARVARATVVDASDRHYLVDLPDFCREHGRPDLARAVERALARSRLHDPFRPLVRWLRRFPVVGPATRWLEARVQDSPVPTRRSP